MSGWIGVDLDGTLAEYGDWKGPDHIGAPIPAMVERVKRWLAEGREVRIFTARVWNAEDDAIAPIRAWCTEHIGQEIPITCTKDYGMIELWDDRAVRVAINAGEPCCSHHERAKVGWSPHVCAHDGCTNDVARVGLDFCGRRSCAIYRPAAEGRRTTLREMIDRLSPEDRLAYEQERVAIRDGEIASLREQLRKSRMGMFDTILVPCPACGEREEAQTKSGPCILYTWLLEDAPEDTLENVNRHAPFECHSCGAEFRVVFKVQGKTVRTDESS